MNHKNENGESSLPLESATALRSYPASWKGQLLIVCGKCRRKLRRGDADQKVRKLKKSLKHLAKLDQEGTRLRVIEVSCLKMCPKGGVTVCTQGQIGRGQRSIVRAPGDVDALYAQCKAEAGQER